MLLPHGLHPLLSTDCFCQQMRSINAPVCSLKPMELAVWESWDEVPYHVVVGFGPITLDGDGLSDDDTLLMGWEDYFRGGAYLGLLSQKDAVEHGIPQHNALSLMITKELRRAFGLFHPDLLLPSGLLYI